MGQLERMRTGWLERTLAVLAWVARKRGQNEAVAAHLATGIDGEAAAFSYLRGNDYTVLARRWSSGDVPGDIDLIAWKGAMLCFVEVKTRTARDASPAEVAIDSHKRNTLRRLARRYVSQLSIETAPPARFDVVSVYLLPGEEREFQHFEGAFGWSEREDYERR